MSHGVNVSEVPTGARPPVRVTSTLPVYTGTAPINMGDLTAFNKPLVFYTLAEAQAALGALVPSSKWKDWTLHEAINAHFLVHEVAPIVCINVLDPTNARHYALVTGAVHLIGTDGSVALQTYGAPDEAVLGILPSTVVIKKAGVAKALGVDYTLSFNDTGAMVVTVIEGGALSAGNTITADFRYLDPSGVTGADVIGGFSNGAYTGLEVIEQVYPSLRLVPGLLLAPKYSQLPTVAARLAVIAGGINGSFRAHALVDLSTSASDIAYYGAAAAWKTNHGFNAIDETPCWPLFKSGDDVYHLSTLVACVLGVNAAANDGVPMASPSNKGLIGTAAALDDGTQVLLPKPAANALNAQGIVTALNGFNGWKVWGNRTGIYPGSTDPKDAFIPIRLMFNWIQNTIVLTADRDVDEPGNRRLVDGVLGTIGSWLNGLVQRGALARGDIEFRGDDNPATDISDGILRFHITASPFPPAEQLDFIVEFDPNALASALS